MRTSDLEGTGGIRVFERLAPETGVTVQARRADDLYRQATILHSEVAEHRRDLGVAELEDATIAHAKTDVTTLLADLRSLGISWRQIASAVRVSVPAIQKWRRGEGVSPANHVALAKLRGLIDLLSARSIDDPVSWLEMPVGLDVKLSRLDLLSAQRTDLVLELAGDEYSTVSLEPLLDRFDPDWRSKYRDDAFETFRDAEGIVGIRPRA